MRFFTPDSFDKASKELVKDGHRYFGEMCLMQAWGLAQKADRSDAEQQHMLHAAHAARFHWTMLGDRPGLARADHVLSFIFSALGETENARTHAESCFAFVQEGGKGFTPTHEAWAHECMARTCNERGQLDKRDEHLEAAQDAAIRIGVAADMKAVFKALSQIDGFESKYDVKLD